jgi:SHS2 domain-containing protein
MSYKYLEHIGDAAIEATATTLGEVFAEAGRAMFAIMIDTGAAPAETTVDIKAEAATYEELLVEFLNELLAQQCLHKLIFTDCRVSGIAPRTGGGYALTATASGVEPKHASAALGHEVKAVTYMGLKVAREDGNWVVRCVLDL